jgi:protein O-mannosyl-transferase
VLVEKIPLLALSAASCTVTAIAQHSIMAQVDNVPLELRAANALISYVAYIGSFLSPAGLAVFYPYPDEGLPVWRAAAAFVALAGVSAGALLWRRRCPYWLVGWCWYLGMLVPMIGLVQVGEQVRADRYTYLPQIGLCVALVWGANRWTSSWPRRRSICSTATLLALSCLIGCAWQQTSYWRNGETLWARALAATERNAVAHNNLGNMLSDRGLVDEAMAHYRQALEANPQHASAHYNLAGALLNRGQVEEAIAHYRSDLEIRPDDADARNYLGVALQRCGRAEEAIEQHRRAVELKPEKGSFHYSLALALSTVGRFDEAIAHYRAAIQQKPDAVEARHNLGTILYRQGKTAEAVAQLREALRRQPDYVLSLDQLAWIRATCPQPSVRNGAEAVELAQRAAQLSDGRQPAIFDTLAAAYAEAGRYGEAVDTAQKAIDLARQQRNAPLVESIQARLRLYQTKKPFRE